MLRTLRITELEAAKDISCSIGNNFTFLYNMCSLTNNTDAIIGQSFYFYVKRITRQDYISFFWFSFT